MLQSGIKQTMVFGSISTIILLLTVNFDWVKKIADRIWNWFLHLLGYIFSGIDTPPPVEETPMGDVNQATSEIGDVIDREMFPESHCPVCPWWSAAFQNTNAADAYPTPNCGMFPSSHCRQHTSVSDYQA